MDVAYDQAIKAAEDRRRARDKKKKRKDIDLQIIVLILMTIMRNIAS